MASAEPVAKKAKVTEDGEAASVVPKEPEVPKELEGDAPEVTKAKCIQQPVVILGQDTTLNAMVGNTQSGMLSSLTDGGFQHLMAGARANVGAKAGRYMYEVRIMQLIPPQGGRVQGKPQVLRVGFSTEGSSLYAGETEDSVCFDLEGAYIYNKKRIQVKRFPDASLLAVVLNLDKKSPNANTVSLFADGVRVTQPQALPENLVGKTLFPTVTFRNVTISTNFGSVAQEPLPFKCRMFQDASTSDVVMTKPAPPAGKDGKYEVLFPVGIPDEGLFDWADMFLKSHPDYAELSDRVILDMAEKSGIRRPHGYASLSAKDRPHMGFNVPELDDQNVRRVLQNIAPAHSRNFLVLELKGNLMLEERQASLSRFPSHMYTRVAHVCVGEPTPEFKKRSQQLNQSNKQKVADVVFRKQQAEDKRKRIVEKKQRDLEKVKNKALKQRKKAEEKRKRDVEAALKKKKDEAEKKRKEAAGEKVDNVEKDEEKNEEPEEEEPESEEEQEADPAEEKDEEPPTVSLTPEEKAERFVLSGIPDLSPEVLSAAFTKFSLPRKTEGFDEVRYEWNKDGKKCDDLLKEWVMGKKMTTRVEDIKPSPWFSEQLSKWNKQQQEWRSKQNEYRNKLAKKAAAKVAAENAKKAAAAKKVVAAAKVAAVKAAKAKKREADAKKREADRAAGKEVEEEKEEEAEDEEEKEEEKDDGKEAEENGEDEPEVDFDNLDVFGDADICDLGGGMTLFNEFQNEDWSMMQLRFECHLLVHAFRSDCKDPDRTGIHVNHLPFYYQVYFKKQLTTRQFGVESFADVVGLVKDTVFLTKQQIMEPQCPEEMESFGVFARVTESARRHRNLLLDLGDESARLKLVNGASGGGGQKGGGNWGGNKPQSGQQQGGGQQQKWNKQGGNGGGGRGGQWARGW